MITTKISIKPHLAEYLTAKYWNEESSCVILDDKLDLYHTIWNLVEKRPINCGVDTGNLEIGLPDRRIGKDPAYYNYLGQRSAKLINSRTETLFFMELHQLLDDNKYHEGIEYNDTCFEFMKMYRIESISSDAILKDFYRWRERVRKRKKKRAYKRT